MEINHSLTLDELTKPLQRFWEHSARKIRSIEQNFDHALGTPVFTVEGKYTTRGWTEWTQGFEFGSSLLQYDATGEAEFLELGKQSTVRKMAPHLTHTGVHDHGFNNISTYGNLLRMMSEGKVAENEGERNFYKLALSVSGSVQAMRWTAIKDGGFIYSFNGPHSLFVDTIRSCRILMISDMLGHVTMGENDKPVNLFERALSHLKATAQYSVFYGEGRDIYDEWGRTAHEIIFNTNDGNYRCPNSQQGYTGFTTWTRGLAWAMCGFAEELEYLKTLPESKFAMQDKAELMKIFIRAAKATSDFYISHTTNDGIPYWDAGAPGLVRMKDLYSGTSDPYNDIEPVDSSAASIAAQGLLRLGLLLKNAGEEKEGAKYFQAGLTVCKTLLAEPYLSVDDAHQGLILHSVYHRPNGWDHIPSGRKIPCDESSMWGDYHAREAMLYLTKIIRNEPYYSFFSQLQ